MTTSGSFTRTLFAIGVLTSIVSPVRAVDFTNGLITAVPVKDGKPPVIDGELGDWDLSAQEPSYIAAQTIDKMNAQWAVMYDDEAIYFSAEVAMPDRPYTNKNNPQDAFWKGDLPQVRIAADPALAYPLDRARDQENNRVVHLSFWKNTQSGKDYIQLTRGVTTKLGKEVLPEGSEIVLKPHGDTGYVVEVKLPWSALLASDGRNPFKPGDRTAILIETLWIGGDPTRVAMGYRENPGNFGFRFPEKWGQLEFAAKSSGKRVRPTMAALIDEAKAAQASGSVTVGVPITLDVPDDGLKVSVNILDEKGGIIRDLIGGEPHPKGKLEVRWDGRDAFGRPLEPGNYTWSAYFHKGLKAEYQGGVGSSGRPFYNTADGRGAWGGDHSNPIDAAADGDSLYLLWPISESGRPLVKTTLDGKVLWRVNPFVSGGFGPFHALAVEGDIVYLVRGPNHLARVDAKTGSLLTWGQDGPTELDIFEPIPELVPAESTPMELQPPKKADPYPEGMTRQPESSGIAVRDGKVYMSSHSLGKVYVVKAADGERLDVLDLPGARGLALDKKGDLYGVSYVAGAESKVIKFAGGAGKPIVIIGSGLDAPYDVAVDKEGRIAVSDLGASSQVKIFDASGKLLRALGTKGGRPWQGAYDAKGMAFLKPAGLAIDSEGALIVAESALPKVFSRINPADGTLIDRWFGPGIYWNSTWAMPEDPRHIFYMLGNGIGRARLGTPDSPGVPDAYWNPSREFPQVDGLDNRFPQPDVLRATNGELYFVKDSGDRAILLLREDGMRPLATWTVRYQWQPDNLLKKNYTEVWIDRNGDGHVQEEEKNVFAEFADGTPLPTGLRNAWGGLRMTANGDLYFPTTDNSILRVPARGFGENGLIDWDLSKVEIAVPQIVPGRDKLPQAGRFGAVGVLRDGEGNFYTAINAKFNGRQAEYDFPTPEAAKRMLEGLGHTSRSNVVKFAKFDAQGNRLWIAGRKATSGATPGEMYHFWNMAGLINDRYVAGATEWGQIYFYTEDGFYVDAIMDNPSDVRQPGPYTFGGETPGGRVQYFPKLDELWAYSLGMAYKVSGFSNGRVEGESRARGTVTLDKIYDLAAESADEASGPLVIVSLRGKPMDDATVWRDVPTFALKANRKPLAVAQLGQDKKFLYARIAVKDESPLENTADPIQLAFKQGDTAGFVLGPVSKSKKAGSGDVRFMAVQYHGEAKLVAMKVVTTGDKKPFEYFTPAGGTQMFEFVGEVPGGQVRLEKTDDGYVATLAIPRSFLEFDLKSETALRGDIEVRLSGAGGRGIQTTSRNYLFTPSTTETSMTDDVPTESRMYPEYWGPIELN